MATRWMILSGWVLVLTGSASAQPIDLAFLKTRAEATDFQETTRYEEVMAFTEIVASGAVKMYRTVFGYTSEGRALPLVVFGDVDGAGPRGGFDDDRGSGRDAEPGSKRVNGDGSGERDEREGTKQPVQFHDGSWVFEVLNQSTGQVTTRQVEI